MAIITVSRELAALGDETAGELSKLLGYRFVDKNSLEERIKSCGIEGQKFVKYDERKPSFFASLSHDRDDYLHYLKTAIFAEAEQGNCVFIGRGAAVVLKSMPGLISMFLASPLNIRIERVKSYFQCDERRARQILDRSDRDRIGFHRYFFDIDWRHPGNYHLSFNTGVLHPADCAKIINQLKERFFTPEAEAQSAARLKELVLEQRVKHCIMYEQEIPIHFLEISVCGNNISLYGVANSQALVDAALNAVNKMPGMEEDPATIQNEIQVVREYSVMP
ncbi:MAG: cytidylate kinase-like family protein [Treponema sp.]|jgi:cytidylate kinase|nr:cytidylate kinase-like family protein [Treponema sp.]